MSILSKTEYMETALATATPSLSLADINVRMAALRLEADELTKMKAMFQPENKKVLNKARAIFYHKQKTNPDLLADIRDKLRSVNLLITKSRIIGGAVVTTEVIPWRLVREYTDSAFDALPVPDRRRLLDAARTALCPGVV